MSRYKDDELSKKDMFWMGVVLAAVATSLLWYYGNKWLNSLPPEPEQPVASEVKVPPKPVATAEIVGETKLPYKGRSLVEVKTKSGFTCFVGVTDGYGEALSTSCNPTPVKQDLHM